jgi:ferrous-iron efflux pump FieF
MADAAAAATSATPARTRRLLLLATRASVLTALVLIAGKAVAWLLTGSVSVLASLVDSMLDAAASIINLLAVRYALAPPDDEHRFGHGKAEALAGLGQATFIAGSSVFLVLQAVERLLHPQPLQDVTVAVAVMLFAIAATAILVQIQRYVIRHTHSTAIRADSLHYLTDLLTNLSTLLALGLAVFGWTGADPLFALGIAVYILYSAWQIGYEAVELLMDRELPTPDQERVYAIARSQPLVQGVHDVRTRRSGQTYFIQLHLEMDPTLPLVQAHAVADEVYLSLRSAFPNADVLIHEDPAGVEDIEHRQWTVPPAAGKP